MESQFSPTDQTDREYIITYLNKLAARWPNAVYVMLVENTGDPKGAKRIEGYWNSDMADEHLTLAQPSTLRFWGCATYNARLDPKDPDRPGVDSTHENKLNYVSTFGSLLTSKRIYISEYRDFVLSNPNKTSYDDCVLKLRTQFQNFSHEMIQPKTGDDKAHKKVKYTVSGKRWGVDDVCMSTLWCQYFSLYYASGRDFLFNQAMRDTRRFIPTTVTLVDDY